MFHMSIEKHLLFDYPKNMFSKYRIQGNAAFNEKDMRKALMFYKEGHNGILRLSEIIRVILNSRESSSIVNPFQIYTKNTDIQIKKRIVSNILIKMLQSLRFEESLHAVNISSVFLRTKRTYLALTYCKYAYYTFLYCIQSSKSENKVKKDDSLGYSDYLENFFLNRMCVLLLHSGHLRSILFYYQKIRKPFKKLRFLLQNCHYGPFEEYINYLNMRSISDMANMPQQNNRCGFNRIFNTISNFPNENRTRRDKNCSNLPFNLPNQEDLKNYLNSYLGLQENEHKIKSAQKINRKNRIVECIDKVVQEKEDVFECTNENINYSVADTITQEICYKNNEGRIVSDKVYKFNPQGDNSLGDIKNGKNFFIKFNTNQNDEISENKKKSIENGPKHKPGPGLKKESGISCIPVEQPSIADSKNTSKDSTCPFFSSTYNLEYYQLTYDLLSPQFILNTVYLLHKMNVNSFNIGYIQTVNNKQKDIKEPKHENGYHSSYEKHHPHIAVYHNKKNNSGFDKSEKNTENDSKTNFNIDLNQYPIDDEPTEEESEMINEYLKKKCIRIHKLCKLNQSNHIFMANQRKKGDISGVSRTSFSKKENSNEIFSEKNPEKSSENDVFILGDTHGNLPNTYFTIRTITKNFSSSFNGTIVFNGDIVDRGESSIELLVFLYLLEIYYDLSDRDCDQFECHSKESHTYNTKGSDKQGIYSELSRVCHKTEQSRGLERSLDQRKNLIGEGKDKIRSQFYNIQDSQKTVISTDSEHPINIRLRNHILYRMPLKTTTKRIFINRGNHEFKSVNQRSTFFDELLMKYPFYHKIIFDLVNYSFRSLVLCTMVDQIMVVHGGILQSSQNAVSLIEQIDRKVEEFRRKPGETPCLIEETSNQNIKENTDDEEMTRELPVQPSVLIEVTKNKIIKENREKGEMNNKQLVGINTLTDTAPYKNQRYSFDIQRQLGIYNGNRFKKSPNYDQLKEMKHKEKGDGKETIRKIREEIKDEEKANCIRIALFNKKLKEMVRVSSQNDNNSLEEDSKPKGATSKNCIQTKNTGKKNLRQKNTLFVGEEIEKLYRKVGIPLTLNKKNEKSLKTGLGPEHNIHMSSMLWSDPRPVFNSFPSTRGLGQHFGFKYAIEFLETNNLIAVIRSHEYRPAMERITEEILVQAIKDKIKKKAREEIDKRVKTQTIQRYHEKMEDFLKNKTNGETSSENIEECNHGSKEMINTPSYSCTKDKIFDKNALESDIKILNGDKPIYMTVDCHDIAHKVLKTITSDLTPSFRSTHGHIFTVFSSVDYNGNVNEAVFIMIRNGKYQWYLME